MIHLSASKAREDLAAMIHQVAATGERIVVDSDDGKEQAALIPLEDLRLLERLIAEEEDRIDLEEARKANTEPGAKPWEQVKKELGL